MGLVQYLKMGRPVKMVKVTFTREERGNKAVLGLKNLFSYRIKLFFAQKCSLNQHYQARNV